VDGSVSSCASQSGGTEPTCLSCVPRPSPAALIRARATSVLYDRGGTGWSDPAALPRTAAEVATELHDLLRAVVQAVRDLLGMVAGW
jgi:hypothetical protein